LSSLLSSFPRSSSNFKDKQTYRKKKERHSQQEPRIFTYQSHEKMLAAEL
jgi:hypothetical protein